MIKEDESLSSPIATIFYEFYDSLQTLKERLISQKDQIQCIVSNGFIENEIPYGKTQKPELWDYADNVDSIEFLLSI